VSKIIVLMGAPGAGKGTQAKLISRRFGWPQISTGDIFREHMKNNTNFGKKVKSYMDGNVYVPDKLTNVVIGVKLKQHKPEGFILDGYPRTLAQAEFLDRLLAELETEIDGVINLGVNKEELIKRMIKRGKEEGRMDDTEEGIRSRMHEYETKAEPVVGYYRSMGKIVDINGDQTIEKVFKDIKQVLDRLIG